MKNTLKSRNKALLYVTKLELIVSICSTPLTTNISTTLKLILQIVLIPIKFHENLVNGSKNILSLT